MDGYNAALGPVDEFLPKHFGLATYIARKYMPFAHSFGADVDDLLSVARFALWKAYRSFDPASGVKWATFASACITNACREHMRRLRRYSGLLYLDGTVSDDSDDDDTTLYHFQEGDAIDTSRIEVEDFLASLTERDEAVVTGRITGQRQADIAAVVNISQGGVSRLCKRLGRRYMDADWVSARTV